MNEKVMYNRLGKFFSKMRWLAAPVLLGLLLPWLVGCSGSQASDPAVQPAPNQPTFVWIFKVP